MRAEITISRPGSTGFAHVFPVQVEIHPDGTYTARAGREVPRMRETTRYGELEWEHTSEIEFAVGDIITLSRHELDECRDFVRETQRLLAQAKEALAI